jgi:hypothetical protein
VLPHICPTNPSMVIASEFGDVTKYRMTKQAGEVDPIGWTANRLE